MSDNDIAAKRARSSVALTRRSPYRWARSHIASAAKSAIANRYLYAADLLLSAVALVLAVWLRFGPQMLKSRIRRGQTPG